MKQLLKHSVMCILNVLVILLIVQCESFQCSRIFETSLQLNFFKSQYVEVLSKRRMCDEQKAREVRRFFMQAGNWRRFFVTRKRRESFRKSAVFLDKVG
jgi:hypothetical protein